MKAEMLASRNVMAMVDELHVMFLPQRDELARVAEECRWNIDTLPFEVKAQMERWLDSIHAHELLFVARHESTREGWKEKVMDGTAEWFGALEEVGMMLDEGRVTLEELGLTDEDLPPIAFQAAFYEGWEIHELLRAGELPRDHEARLSWLYTEFLQSTGCSTQTA